MKYAWLAVALVIVSFAIGAWLYPSMPEIMPSHWNERGEVNGYMPRFWGLFLVPLISAAMLLLFMAIPRIDPLRQNVKKFMGAYEGFINVLMGFFFYIYLLTLFWTLDYTFNMVQMLLPAFGLLFIYIGFLLEKVKMNWFIGIRTPWTMSSEKVWDKTHRLGGKLFKVVGIVTVLSLAVQDYAFWIFITLILVVTFYLFAYSYFEYKKERKK